MSFRDQCPRCGKWLSDAGVCRVHGGVGFRAILSAPITPESGRDFWKIAARRLNEITGINELRRERRRRIARGEEAQLTHKEALAAAEQAWAELERSERCFIESDSIVIRYRSKND
jgi:hypothetical protein